MAAPARRQPHPRTTPEPLPAVQRNLRVERARRRARIERDLERRRARRRFAVLLVALLLGAVVLSLTILDQIRSLFGI